MKIGYFCNMTNWEHKPYDVLIDEVRELDRRFIQTNRIAVTGKKVRRDFPKFLAADDHITRAVGQVKRRDAVEQGIEQILVPGFQFERGWALLLG